jgi:hypothetical protein
MAFLLCLTRLPKTLSRSIYLISLDLFCIHYHTHNILCFPLLLPLHLGQQLFFLARCNDTRRDTTPACGSCVFPFPDQDKIFTIWSNFRPSKLNQSFSPSGLTFHFLKCLLCGPRRQGVARPSPSRFRALWLPRRSLKSRNAPQ